MHTVFAPCASRESGVSTLQQLLASRKSVMDAVMTLFERRVDAVGTLYGRCVHTGTGNVYIDLFLCIFRGDPTARQ